MGGEMKDIVEELRAEAEKHCSPDNRSVPLVALLLNAAAEIERLRGPYNPALAMQNVGTDGNTFAEIVKNMKHHLRGSDG